MCVKREKKNQLKVKILSWNALRWSANGDLIIFFIISFLILSGCLNFFSLQTKFFGGAFDITGYLPCKHNQSTTSSNFVHNQPTLHQRNRQEAISSSNDAASFCFSYELKNIIFKKNLNLNNWVYYQQADLSYADLNLSKSHRGSYANSALLYRGTRNDTKSEIHG